MRSFLFFLVLLCSIVSGCGASDEPAKMEGTLDLPQPPEATEQENP